MRGKNRGKNALSVKLTMVVEIFTGFPIGNEAASCARYYNYDATTKLADVA